MANRPRVPVKKTDDGFTGAAYNHVAMGANLRLISLASANFKVNGECLVDKKRWKLSYDWVLAACHFDRDLSTISAIFEYEVVAKLGRKTALRGSAEYVVAYDVPADSDEVAAKGFCNNVGAFAAYPYFRGLVAQMTAGANLTLPPLPTIASTAHIPKKAVSAVVENES